MIVVIIIPDDIYSYFCSDLKQRKKQTNKQREHKNSWPIGQIAKQRQVENTWSERKFC